MTSHSSTTEVLIKDCTIISCKVTLKNLFKFQIAVASYRNQYILVRLAKMRRASLNSHFRGVRARYVLYSFAFEKSHLTHERYKLVTFNNARRAHNFTLASNRLVPNWESQNKHLRNHSVWPITKDTDKPVNQSKSKVHAADENRGKHAWERKIGFGFTSDWMKKWRGFDAKPITYDMKTALFSMQFSNFVNSTI